MNLSLIGVDVDDFRLEPKAALKKAAELAFHNVELATVAGDLAPTNLSATGRRHLARLVDGLGLALVSLVADLPGLSLTDARTVDERVEQTCAILELAADLGVRVVTASLGAATDPETGEPSALALEALAHIGEFADSRGTVYAIRPALDAGDRLAGIMDALRCPAIQVALDPAALVMRGHNPVKAIDRWAEQMALVHLRDATVGEPQAGGQEMRLTEGDVDLVGFLAALDSVDYHGPAVIRRIDSKTPIADIQHARDTLKKLLPPGPL